MAAIDASTAVRVAVDIGGTFTDLHLHDPRSGRTLAWKTPSTPADPSLGLIAGLEGVTASAGLSIPDIGLILHGSTIATNAVLERKLPPGALITTRGFRDVLEIGRHMRNDVYTLNAEPRSLLIPREHRYELSERVLADGSIETPPSQHEIDTLCNTLVTAGIEAVAICLLHGYRNPVHELAVAAAIRERLPAVSVTTSFESSPEIREYERTSTTVMNALLQPVISGYLERVESRLQQAGVRATLYLVQSNGGLATPEAAAVLPAKLLLSGPAGGAMAMASLAQRHGFENLVGFDMGGTSTDISVVSAGSIGETAESVLDGLPVRLPMVDVRTIGAGGGSIARCEAGALRVGPHSAGADPGPACYQRGGAHPTVTDANAALLRIDPAAFRTGNMQLDTAAAVTAVDTHISKPLAFVDHNGAADTHTAAAGIIDIATAHMAGAVRLSLFEKGEDPGDYAIAPFGGAAGLHACAVAEELGIDRMVFPAHASTLSALGILYADLRYDLSESRLLPTLSDSVIALADTTTRLRQQANDLLEQAGIAPERRTISFTCDMRYRGQAFELATPWPALDDGSTPDNVSLAALVADFHALHERRFTHASPQDDTEIVTVRAVATGLLPKPAGADHKGSGPAQSEAPVVETIEPEQLPTRTLHLDGNAQSVPVITRTALTASRATLTGPLVVEEEYTVLLIAKGWQVTASPDGNGDLMCHALKGVH